MRLTNSCWRVFLLVMGCALPVLAQTSPQPQQIADPEFKPSIDKPTHTGANRPVVVLDEAHQNFHTASGRYNYGRGRVVVMGEAAMFSAQVTPFTDPNGRVNEMRMGMNVAGNDNRQFLLNVMKWLTRS
jgi:hypothetical protein